MKTLTKAQVFQHMANNARTGKSPVDGLECLIDGIKWDSISMNSPIGGFMSGDTEFRITPRTHNLNGYDVPASETEAPAIGTKYWVLDSFERDGVCQHSWSGDKCELDALRNGLWLSEEDAIANAKALRGENPYE